MFDVGFSELIVIGVVALVVIGPERLPRVARTVGTLLGRAQRYVNEVKAEVNREIEIEELKKLQTQVQDAARSFEQQMTSAASEVQSNLSAVEQQLDDSLREASAPDKPAELPMPAGLSEPPIEGEAPAAEAPPPAAASASGEATASGAGPEQGALFPEQTIRDRS